MSEIGRIRPIGGFLGLELPRGEGGLRELWDASDERLAFVTASAAFAQLIEVTRCGAVWLPAYICPEFAQTAPVDRLRYYPLDADLSPRVDVLANYAREGDLVVGVDFFGRAPGRPFLDYVASSPHILFLEDCAQAMETGQPAWGDWRLFSPRKLVGVADGGLLVPCSDKARGQTGIRSVRDDRGMMDIVKPQLARFEDEDEAHNEVWHGLYRAKEASFPISNQRVSRLTWALLGLLDAESIAERRRRNFAELASRLGAWAYLTDQFPPFVPFGFPVRLPPERRAAVQGYLHQQKIFSAVHWANPPSPASEFPAEHRLAAKLLTLPCDQRYGEAEMCRVAEAFVNAVGRT